MEKFNLVITEIIIEAPVYLWNIYLDVNNDWASEWKKMRDLAQNLLARAIEPSDLKRNSIYNAILDNNQPRVRYLLGLASMELAKRLNNRMHQVFEIQDQMISDLEDNDNEVERSNEPCCDWHDLD